MPATTPCAHCRKVGLVRREHVIQRGRYEIQYYCGHCQHTWTVAGADDDPKRVRTARPVEEIDKPDHSR